MKVKESEKVELKRSTSELKQAIVSMAAILNKHREGKVYFGIRNDGTAVGQVLNDKTIRDISQAINANIEPKIYPEIFPQKIKGKSCIVLRFEGTEAPYFAFGRAYIRVGDENRQLSANELEKIFLRKDKEGSRWESQISSRSFQDVNIKTVKEFIKKANEARRLNYKFDNLKNILSKLGLLKGQKLLRAAEILFCKRNTLEMQAAVFAGNDKVTFLDIQQFRGDLFFLLEKAETYIKEHMNWRVEIAGLERQEIPEVPISAVREALVNSFCHRDYSEPKSNEIAIFKNRIEIYNPGQFPKEYTPEDFIKGKERSILRNPLIAGVLYLKSDIEKWGSGLKRIHDSCQEAKVGIKFRKLKSGFLVIFYRQEIRSQGLVKGLAEGLAESQQKILELMKQNPRISKKELSLKIGISTTAIDKNIIMLKKKKMIRRKGPAKGGYWEII